MNEQIDIAPDHGFRSFRIPKGSDRLSAVFQSQPKCVISKSHPLSHKDEIHLEELKTEPMIAISPEVSQGAYNNIVNLCEVYGFTPVSISYSNSIQDTALMVESGLGFSILDENCISSANEAICSIPVHRGDPLMLVAVWKKKTLIGNSSLCKSSDFRR